MGGGVLVLGLSPEGRTNKGLLYKLKVAIFRENSEGLGRERRGVHEWSGKPEGFPRSA